MILVSALGEHSERVSMAAARKVLIDGFAAAKGASDVLVPKRPLAELFGQRLPKTIANLGVDIQNGVSVQSIECANQPDSNAAVVTSDQILHCDHVICAVPWHRAADIVACDTVRKDLIRCQHFPMSPITGVHLWFDRPVTDRPHAVLVGTTSQWLFQNPFRVNSHSGTQSDDDSGAFYCQVVISASSAGTECKEALVRRVHDELKHAFAGAQQAKLLRSRVVTDPRSVFSITPEVQRLRPPATTALPWLHLAGDWIDTGWPATMEGAVIGGRMAAASIANKEGLDIPIDPGLKRGLLARWLIH